MVTAARMGLLSVMPVYVCYVITEVVRMFAWMQGRPVPPLTRHIIAEVRPFFLGLVVSRLALGALLPGPFDLYLLLSAGAGCPSGGWSG
ncbi:hypothetical protein Vau01_106190 [Virgisporangium aurantiacum]|uniref:Uncharacterized protein n=1 Tax=Virgisporangium aurantiacum TaxID=175570 RepID=A0A8J4E6F4_9ACTN|nr:hypothetical protein Vau01_106190 [Virgisporangium aurantiacum]